MEEATLANLEELMRIERQCFTGEAFTREQIAILLKSPDAIGLLARIDGEVAGFIIGGIQRHVMTKIGHIYTIDVAVKHRRRGIGVKLLNEMEKTFSKRGAKTSVLEVRVDNQAARQLYKKQGYLEAEELHNYYSKGIHGLRLVKQLESKRSPFVRL